MAAPAGRSPLPRGLPLLLIVLALAHGALYAALTPPWQAPDEPRHYLYARLIHDLGRVPTASDARAASDVQLELVHALQATEYWQIRGRQPAPVGDEPSVVQRAIREGGLRPALNHPPLPYAIGALLLRPLSGQPVLGQMYALRALSVLLSVVAAAVAYRLCAMLLPDDPAAWWAAGLFVALLPMQAFVAGSVNNDPPAQLLASFALLALARLVEAGWSWRRGVSFALATGLALACKDTALFLLPLGLTALPLMPTRRPGALVGGGLRRLAVGALAVAVLVGVVLVSWRGITAWAWTGRFGQHLLLTFASFWANFGWMNVPLDVGWYVVLASLTLVASAGWLAAGARLRAGASERARLWALYTLAVVWIVLQAVAVTVARQEPAQGRYLFPALAPIAVCWVAGMLRWVPKRFHRAAALGLVAWWVAFDLIALLGYALPRLYA